MIPCYMVLHRCYCVLYRCTDFLMDSGCICVDNRVDICMPCVCIIKSLGCGCDRSVTAPSTVSALIT